MRSHAPFEPIVITFCKLVRVVDLITDTKFFFRNRLRAFGVTGPPKRHLLYLGPNAHRPCNSVSTTGLHCD